MVGLQELPGVVGVASTIRKLGYFLTTGQVFNMTHDPFKQMAEDWKRDYSIMYTEMKEREDTRGRAVWFRASYGHSYFETVELLGSLESFADWWNERHGSGK